MQTVTKNPDEVQVVAKVLRRKSSVSVLGSYFHLKTKFIFISF